MINSMSEVSNLEVIFSALKFSADKHRMQRRKDAVSPYINHPIEVAELLIRVAGIRDTDTIVAAILHDTVEDTATTSAELKTEFGEVVSSLVMECTDDKSLPKQERKRLQIEHAPHKSPKAKLVKIADKICNIKDISHNPPPDWTTERRREYLDWAQKVVAGLRGANQALDAHFDAMLEAARKLV